MYNGVLASVPTKFLASLASCESESFQNKNLHVLRIVPERNTGQCHENMVVGLMSEETKLLLRTMEARVEWVLLWPGGMRINWHLKESDGQFIQPKLINIHHH